jgi:uncharacterized membrane protein YoaT (DUF817 family)
MEMSINLKAIRWSYLFTVIALFAWTIYDFVYSHKFSLAGYILITQNLLYLFISQILKWKMDDTNGRTSFILSMIGTVVLLLLFRVLLIYYPG